MSVALQCSVCEKPYKSAKRLETHMAHEHGDGEAKPRASKSKSPPPAVLLLR